MLSIPLISPLAIDGAAPMTTMNRIVASDSWKIPIASGIQATDGIVINPVISDPKPDRSTRLLATIAPTAVPITSARHVALDRALHRGADSVHDRARSCRRGTETPSLARG